MHNYTLIFLLAIQKIVLKHLSYDYTVISQYERRVRVITHYHKRFYRTYVADIKKLYYSFAIVTILQFFDTLE